MTRPGYLIPPQLTRGPCEVRATACADADWQPRASAAPARPRWAFPRGGVCPPRPVLPAHGGCFPYQQGRPCPPLSGGSHPPCPPLAAEDSNGDPVPQDAGRRVAGGGAACRRPKLSPKLSPFCVSFPCPAVRISHGWRPQSHGLGLTHSSACTDGTTEQAPGFGAKPADPPREERHPRLLHAAPGRGSLSGQSPAASLTP